MRGWYNGYESLVPLSMLDLIPSQVLMEIGYYYCKTGGIIPIEPGGPCGWGAVNLSKGGTKLVSQLLTPALSLDLGKLGPCQFNLELCYSPRQLSVLSSSLRLISPSSIFFSSKAPLTTLHHTL